MQQIKLDETLRHFLDMFSYNDSALLFCYVSFAFLLPAEVIKRLTISLPAIRLLINFLEKTSENSEFYCTHNFGPFGEHVKMQGSELVVAITALAHNTTVRSEMVINSVFEYLVKYGAATDDTCNQELILIAIYALLEQNTLHSAAQVAGLALLVEKLTRSNTDGVRHVARRVSVRLETLKVRSTSNSRSK